MSDESIPSASSKAMTSLRIEAERRHVRLTIRNLLTRAESQNVEGFDLVDASVEILPQEAREVALTLLDAARAIEDGLALIVIKGGRP